MSLRTNLATRPFYNERAVQVLLVIAALVVAAVTVFNARQLYALTAKDRALVASADAAEDRTRTLTRDIARTRTGIDAAHVADVSAAAHEANVAIGQRVFSWTDLFNRLEAALPGNVRLASVKPEIDQQGRLVVTVGVVSKNVAGIEGFLDALEKTGAFRGLLSRQEHESKEGFVEASVEGIYDPSNAGSGAR
jgi:Tfp pilus assembly protein PilN